MEAIDRQAAGTPAEAGEHGWTRWIPFAAMALASTSYLLTGNDARGAGSLGIAAIAGALTLVQGRRGRVFASTHISAWLPIVVPLVLSRLTEDPIRWVPSFLLLLFASTMALVAASGHDPRRPILVATNALVTAFRVVIATVIGVVVLLPLGIARLWRRHDPLGTGKGDASGSAWHDVQRIPATPGRTFRLERGEQPSMLRSTLRMGTQAVGITVIILALDLGVGWAWQTARGTDPTPTVISDNIGATAGVKTGESDPREDLPAMADSPWIHDWFQEWNTRSVYYVPYLLWQNAPYKGRYLNIGDDGERSTYRAKGVTRDDAPTVAFLGGSTTIGLGQRDQHTIASEVARLAEADGLPIIADNHGVSGWVNWQEVLLFEQLAANPATRPDIALFYDGANEVGAQQFDVLGIPSHSALDQMEQRLDDPLVIRDASPAAPTDELKVTIRDLLRRYQETSASSQLYRWAREQLDPPASAQSRNGLPPTQEEIDAAVDVYHRGRDLALHLAERYDVDPIFFWQPRGMTDLERESVDDIGPPTIDLTHALDGEEQSAIYIDGNHHNERGAEIVAAAIWEHLKPRVQAWYDANG